MSYTPTVWVEGVTKLGPTNLNKIEQGIANASGGSGGGSITTLSVSAASSATVVTFGSTDNLVVGQLVGIGVGTSKCEVRRITGITGSDATLRTALQYDHAVGESVQASDFWIPIVWWGARPGDSSFDSFRNLSNMLIDLQTGGVTYGLVGAGYGTANLFYSSLPLWLPDTTVIERASFAAFVPFDLDCTLGVWGEDNNYPHQHFLYSAGQFGTLSSVSTTADSVTFSSDPGTQTGGGEPVAFYIREGKGTLPGGLEEGRTYYCKEASGTTRTLCIDKRGASTVDITSDMTGEVCWFSPGLSRLFCDQLYVGGGGSNGNIRGLNGYYAILQQQSCIKDMRVENFAGWGCTVSGQQSEWINPEIINNARGGTRFSTAEFFFHHGGNWEANDINIEFSDINIQGASASTNNVNNLFSGVHFESPGSKSRLTQTITITGAPASGAGTINGVAFSYTATSAEIQTIMDTLFGAGNSVVTGGALPTTPIQIVFQGVYQYGWGPTLTLSNGTIAGGTFAINTVNPSGRCISYRQGNQTRFVNVNETTSNKADGTSVSFVNVEGVAALTSAYNIQGYEIMGLYSLALTDYLIEDANRGNIRRGDSLSDGTSGHLNYYAATSRHGASTGRHWWYFGDGGRYTTLGSAGVPNIETVGGTNQANPLVKLTPSTNQTGACLEAYNTTGTMQTRIGADGRLGIGSASSTNPVITSFTASPQGVVSAPVGSICFNTAGGASTTLYVREAATGATSGWVAK